MRLQVFGRDKSPSVYQNQVKLTYNGLLVEVGRVLADQFVENVIIKPDAFASAGAFNVLKANRSRYSRRDPLCCSGFSDTFFFDPFLLPGAVARVQDRHYLLHKVIGASVFSVAGIDLTFYEAGQQRFESTFLAALNAGDSSGRRGGI